MDKEIGHKQRCLRGGGQEGLTVIFSKCCYDQRRRNDPGDPGQNLLQHQQ